MPDIIAVTRDDIEHRFQCSESAYVLDAAEEAGLYLPSVCRHGRCGTCWAKVLSGRFELAPYEAGALPAAPGSVLLCRCRPRENLVVQLPCRDAQIGRRHAPERRASVAAVTPADQGWGALSLRLHRDGEYGQAAEFCPGQYVELRVPGTALWPRIAMANLPNDDGLLEFLLPATRGEALSAWLADVRRGAEVQLRGPLGRFALDEKSPRLRCLAGTAAGLSPLLAMLRHLAALRDRTRVHFIFAATAAELAFVERHLASLRPALPQLTTSLVTTDAVAALGAQLAKNPEMDIYLCGPPPFLEAAAAAARAGGVAETRIRSEAITGTKEGAAEILTGT